MKKQLFFIAALAMFGLSANAQDTIVLKTQDVIIARDIKSVDENIIEFNRKETYYESIDTTTYSVKMNKVAGIIYHDGKVDKINTVILNSYTANRHKGHVLYNEKDFESFLKYIPRSIKPHLSEKPSLPEQPPLPEEPSYAIMWNPTLFLSNNLALSFEYKKKKNAVELELGYIYPLSFESSFYSFSGDIQPDLNFTELCYNGISSNIFLKHYCPGEFYYGLSVLFKYEYFKDRWIPDGTTEDSYDLNCSQTREVFGLAFRCGWQLTSKYLTWEPYIGVGLRVLNSETTYNYFTQVGYGMTFYEQPFDDGKLFGDNGIALVPYINLGFKVGFGWEGKSKKSYL